MWCVRITKRESKCHFLLHRFVEQINVYNCLWIGSWTANLRSEIIITKYCTYYKKRKMAEKKRRLSVHFDGWNRCGVGRTTNQRNENKKQQQNVDFVLVNRIDKQNWITTYWKRLLVYNKAIRFRKIGVWTGWASKKNLKLCIGPGENIFPTSQFNGKSLFCSSWCYS